MTFAHLNEPLLSRLEQFLELGRLPKALAVVDGQAANLQIVFPELVPIATRFGISVKILLYVLRPRKYLAVQLDGEGTTPVGGANLMDPIKEVSDGRKHLVVPWPLFEA